jgi:hypothetical protein
MYAGPGAGGAFSTISTGGGAATNTRATTACADAGLSAIRSALNARAITAAIFRM